MFTGIIEQCGIVTQKQSDSLLTKVWISSDFNDLSIGESIAIDGVCFTVTEINGNEFCIDISPETLAVTTFKQITVSQKVNLERAMRLSSRLGGHLVSGHVDQLCRVKEILPSGEFIQLFFDSVNAENKDYIVKKGSVAINGVSLTVNDVNETGFTVMLIPHTLQHTNLSALVPGSVVNLEVDPIARIIVQQCQKYFIKE